ncbi:MAG: hypothetical protein QOF76_2720 [Solirubrobacteraceae bacterium]|jgi:hypothetical protein|nr:hypothetical protein [Solirubrobacteraceae bacterium]
MSDETREQAEARMLRAVAGEAAIGRGPAGGTPSRTARQCGGYMPELNVTPMR